MKLAKENKETKQEQNKETNLPISIAKEAAEPEEPKKKTELVKENKETKRKQITYPFP